VQLVLTWNSHNLIHCRGWCLALPAEAVVSVPQSDFDLVAPECGAEY